MGGSLFARRGRYLASLYLFGTAAALGLLAILQANPGQADFVQPYRADPIADVLQWIPATDESERGYAAWTEIPGSPLGVTDALDRLSVHPPPLALGRSGEFQRTVGISASQVTGWASAVGAGATILTGQIDFAAVEASLASANYTEATWRGVTIWSAEHQTQAPVTIEGDDLRAMNVVVPLGDRVLLAIDRRAAEAALATAAGERASLADRPELQRWLGSDMAGIMVVDQRDLAIECGVAGLWTTSDFSEASGRTAGIVYRVLEDGTPVTSVWIDLADDIAAEAGRFTFEVGWRNGFVNQIGLGGPVSALASLAEVRRSGTFVIADLVQGRDNGWVRSGVRFLIDICEHSSAMVPAGQPDRATPVSSPSPEVSQ